MRVAVTGATGVVGTSTVRALVAAGHDVVGLARTPDKAALLESLGARAARTSMFDPDGLTSMFEGSDAVCNLATHLPIGRSAVLPGAFREHDMLRTEGVRCVVEAARRAGVRRIVQESVSFVYADHGDDWVTEESTVGITPATEPASMAEMQIQEYSCRSRSGVVLRFGLVVGDDALTRWTLRAAQRGRPVGMGRPEGWIHVIHTDDLGPAVLAALGAPDGIYNVGAEPLRRGDLARGYANAVGRESVPFLGPLATRLAGARLEPLTRSLRVSSEHFTAQTGWAPRRATFDASWFDVVESETKATR